MRERVARFILSSAREPRYGDRSAMFLTSFFSVFICTPFHWMAGAHSHIATVSIADVFVCTWEMETYELMLARCASFCIRIIALVASETHGIELVGKWNETLFVLALVYVCVVSISRVFIASVPPLFPKSRSWAFSLSRSPSPSPSLLCFKFARCLYTGRSVCHPITNSAPPTTMILHKQIILKLMKWKWNKRRRKRGQQWEKTKTAAAAVASATKKKN